MSLPYGTTVMDGYSLRTLTSMAENSTGISQSDSCWRELIEKENQANMRRWEKNLYSNYSGVTFRPSSSVISDTRLAYFATKHSVPHGAYKPARAVQSARTSGAGESRKVKDLESRLAQMEMQVSKARGESARLRRQVASLTGKLDVAPPSSTGSGSRAGAARSDRR